MKNLLLSLSFCALLVACSEKPATTTNPTGAPPVSSATPRADSPAPPTDAAKSATSSSPAPPVQAEPASQASTGPGKSQSVQESAASGATQTTEEKGKK